MELELPYKLYKLVSREWGRTLKQRGPVGVAQWLWPNGCGLVAAAGLRPCCWPIGRPATSTLQPTQPVLPALLKTLWLCAACYAGQGRWLTC